MNAPATNPPALDVVISVRDVSKAYRIWKNPSARLKAPLWNMVQGLLPRLIQTTIGIGGTQKGDTTPYYKDFYALKNVSFEVHRGETLGIIGRNGSGKSTLLQIIAQTLTPTTGQVTIAGRVAALLELGSGFNPDFTGRENVFLNGAVLGLSNEQIAERYAGIAAFADVDDFMDQPVKTYSSGMIMRLAFAVQAAVDPEVMIIDEALGVGDEAFQQKCFARLRELKDKGTTLLFVSHDASTVINVCDRAILIDQGRIVMNDIPKVVVTQYHKVLFSKKDSASAKAPAPAGLALAQVQTSNRFLDSSVDESFWRADLIASAAVSYTADGLRLFDFVLNNQLGQEVNHLTHRCRYKVRTKAEALHTCYGVVFGSTISTITGVQISGYNTPEINHPIDVVEAGQLLEWEYEFTCDLLPGTYSLELGILGINGDAERRFLHRIVDAMIFRVLPLEFSPVTALVNLSQSGRIQTLTKISK